MGSANARVNPGDGDPPVRPQNDGTAQTHDRRFRFSIKCEISIRSARTKRRRSWITPPLKCAKPVRSARVAQLLLAAALSVPLFQATARATPSPQVVGTWRGAVKAVFMEDSNPDIAFIGSGRRLLILNVANPAAILELGAIDLGNIVLDVAVRDGYAFVCTLGKPNFFCVVDVSDPAAPRLAWTYQRESNFTAEEVDLYLNVAYVRNRTNYRAFDITNPEIPVRSRWDVTNEHPRDSAVDGDRLIMVDNSRYLRIYDLSGDPFRPTELGVVRLPGTENTGSAVCVEGDFAYATTAFPEGMFAIVDISNPNAPAVLGSYDTRSAQDVAVRNGIAYLVDGGDLVILDVATDPNSPEVLTTFRTRGTITGVELVGDRAYVMDIGRGLIILDISDPRNPSELGNYHSPGKLQNMVKVGDLLYLSDVANGITILDISIPAAPRLVGVYQSARSPFLPRHDGGHWGIDVRGGRAYLSAGFSGLEIADVSDPARPTFLGRFEDWPAEGRAIALKLNAAGDVAHMGFTACNGAWIVNFDISDPQNIRDRAAVLLGGLCNDPVALDIGADGIAHVAVEGFLAAADLADPDDPQLLGTQVWPFSDAFNLVVRSNLRYVCNTSWKDDVGGLYIQDVADPADPVQLGYWQLPATGNKGINGVALRGQRAYVVSLNQNAFYELDVANPSEPTMISQQFLKDPRFIYIDGRYAYVTGVGLTIVELSGLRSPGDLNCDGSVDLTDVGPFITALLDPREYENQYPDCDINNGDTNDDGSVDLTDVESFIELLIGP